MFKKFLALATLVCAVPALANAYTLTTWAKSQGGEIDSKVMQNQTVINGPKSVVFTNSSTAYVTPLAGWKISKIEKNGLVQTPPAAGSPYSFRFVAPLSSNVSLYATFARQSVTVNATAGSNGFIVGTSSYAPVYFGNQSPAKTFVFRPQPGYQAKVTAPATLTEGTHYQYLDAVTGDLIAGTLVGQTTTFPADKQIKVVVVNVPTGAASFSFSAAFTQVTVVNPPVVPGFNCANCHASQGVGVGNYEAFAGTPHNNKYNCSGCHVGANTGAHPGVVVDCNTCHGPGQVAVPPTTAGQFSSYSAAHATAGISGNYSATCGVCHAPAAASPAPTDPTSPHAQGGCVKCHSVVQNAGPGFVQDNAGVRAVSLEFNKWSHHVTGVALNDAHCAACHMEGKVSADGKAIVIDRTKHRVDAFVHLRNADTDADMQWDPALPNHSTMDNYCMSCHDANGATSTESGNIQAFINAVGLNATGKTASASNPFGDTISNRYDKMQRPAVVNVNSQFNTSNNSHHGVKGPRYSGRTRVAGPRAIAAPATFAANSSATLWGRRSTIYDGVDAIAGVTGGPREAFNALYVPLENNGGETAPRTGAASLGDDSTLHCGDCHTVGQWKPGSVQNGFTATDPTTAIAGTSVAIGAHGSNNEYLLRNSKATDERHTQDAFTSAGGVITLTNPNAAFLVCYNCHSYERYGSIFNATGSTGPHAGEYDASGRCNGVGNTIPFAGFTTGTNTDGTPNFAARFDGPLSKYPADKFAAGYPLNNANRPATGEQNPDFGDIFGIQCLNCHNSGPGNGYGGIHGSLNNTPGTANTGTPAVAAPAGGAYVNGMGNWTRVERFLPGLGNVMHVPGTLGGVSGGTTAGPVTNSTFSIQVAGVVTTGTTVYTYKTGGITNNTNWEQVAWQQVANAERGVLDTARAGAGCYTLSESSTAASFGTEGEPVAGAGSLEVEAFGTWGGCDDHGGAKGAGDHGFVKRINRPVTY